MKMFRKILSVVLAFVICFAVVGGGVAVAAGIEDMTMITLKVTYVLGYGGQYNTPEFAKIDQSFRAEIPAFLKTLGDIDISLRSESGEERNITIRENKHQSFSDISGKDRYISYFLWEHETQAPETNGISYYIPPDEFAYLYSFMLEIDSGVQYKVTSLPIPPNYELWDSEVSSYYYSYDKSSCNIDMVVAISPQNLEENTPDEQQPSDPTDNTPSDNTQPEGDTPPPNNPIPDNQPTGWAVERVNRAIDEGIIPESFQGQYTQPTTRAEFCALAVALFEKVRFTIEGRKSFEDTADENIEKMAYIGVVGGTNAEGTLFNPSGEITRAAAATLLTNLAKAVGKPLPIQAASFNDNASIPSWALQAVGQVQAAGIMGETGDNMFSPSSLYTRQQSIITMLLLYDAVSE